MKNRAKIFVGVSVLVLGAVVIAVHAYSSNDTVSIPQAELNALFQFADKNKDGSISKEEFGQYLQHLRTKPANSNAVAAGAINKTAGGEKASGGCCGGAGKSEKAGEVAGGCCGGGKSEKVDGNVAKTGKTEKANSQTDTPKVSEVPASDHATLKVGGACGMCKKRIETAAKSLEGVVAATWDTKAQILQVAFNAPQTSLDAISKAVAKVGHDTEKDKADDETYNALHGCCKYRK
jgi:copper chaperone CopZ